MRQSIQACLFLLLVVFTVTACGNKPLQLELPNNTQTNIEASTTVN